MRRTSMLLVAASLAAIAFGCRHPARARSTVAPARPTQYQLQLGKSVFATYCAPCHGDTGAGDGSNSFNLDPHPRDLSDPAFQKKKTDADLKDVIERGGSGVGLSSLMPPWGRTLSREQIDQTILYVRTLRKH